MRSHFYFKLEGPVYAERRYNSSTHAAKVLFSFMLHWVCYQVRVLVNRSRSEDIQPHRVNAVNAIISGRDPASLFMNLLFIKQCFTRRGEHTVGCKHSTLHGI